jgi:deazaflavin-dependent oxidoreductase (nitroreductase family)
MKILFWITIVFGGAVVVFVGLALFERVVPRPVLRWYQRHVGSPLFRWTAGVVPGWVLLETVGRMTGKPRRVPVGGRLQGDTCWLLAGTGRDTQYVRNIEQNPNVRVRVHLRWREGVANPLPDDDTRARLRGNPINGLFLWLTGHDLLTVRIDLEPRKGATPRSR